jgi:hypothetical protein
MFLRNVGKLLPDYMVSHAKRCNVCSIIYFNFVHFTISIQFQRGADSYPTSMLSVGLLNCCWSSPAQSVLASGLVEIYDQDLYSLLDMYVYRSGASSSTKGEVSQLLIILPLLEMIRAGTQAHPSLTSIIAFVWIEFHLPNLKHIQQRNSRFHNTCVYKGVFFMMH